ncbi:cysteine hydrolase family protein [Vibrio tritonius]|uniref:cysteine hydrolase family protein n=1 Tax=Vibrio tritonius TaxID=1435069 RepID=UPI0008394A9F|nr:cysteine hydrolase family protein [Vibrio tritonius]
MKIALLVIDVQQALFDTTPKPYKALEVVEYINQLCNWARESSYPVIYIQHEEQELEVDTPQWQLYEALQPQTDDLFVRKTTPDSFLGTNLQELLQEQGVDRLIICGYATDFCVDTTTRRAAGLGYPILLASDAHTTHDKPHALGANIRQHHNQTLSAMSSFGVPIQLAKADAIVSGSPKLYQFMQFESKHN